MTSKILLWSTTRETRLDTELHCFGIPKAKVLSKFMITKEMSLTIGPLGPFLNIFF